MSFETYEASHITPQYTLLEKINAILGYLKSGKLTARFYMYEGLYDAETTRYDKKYAIGVDEDVGEGDVLLFQNRYLAIIDHLDGDFIVISGRATDIVTSVGHNYKHKVRLQMYKGTTYCNSFTITVISSTSQPITLNNSTAFKNNASYLAQPYYISATDTLEYIDFHGHNCLPLFITRGIVAQSTPNAGYIYLLNMANHVVECAKYAWTTGQGSQDDIVTLKVAGDTVEQI